MRFCEEKDLALCGLACVLCSQQDCPGCKARGCAAGSDCFVYRCAAQKGLDGCYQCDDFPCQADMLQGVRNQAFNRYARRFGKRALLQRLRVNAENGIVYHKPGGLKGDYDALETEEDILRLIAFGSHDPYDKCPVLQTARFVLRLVQPEDAGDLLRCYSDPRSQELFDAATCTSDFRYHTMEQMRECIDFFLLNYRSREFIRFSILDKASRRAVGTMEMFNATGRLAGREGLGVLRVDLASPYESEECLGELLALSDATFDLLMGVDRVVTKAIPSAAPRRAALRAAGFAPFDWPEPGREHYWARESQEMRSV